MTHDLHILHHNLKFIINFKDTKRIQTNLLSCLLEMFERFIVFIAMNCTQKYEFPMEKLSTTKYQAPSRECQLLSLGTHSGRLILNNTVFALANRVQVTRYSHERLFCHTIFKALIFFSCFDIRRWMRETYDFELFRFFAASFSLINKNNALLNMFLFLSLL